MFKYFYKDESHAFDLSLLLRLLWSNRIGMRSIFATMFASYILLVCPSFTNIFIPALIKMPHKRKHVFYQHCWFYKGHLFSFICQRKAIVAESSEWDLLISETCLLHVSYYACVVKSFISGQNSAHLSHRKGRTLMFWIGGLTNRHNRCQECATVDSIRWASWGTSLWEMYYKKTWKGHFTINTVCSNEFLFVCKLIGVFSFYW